VTWTAEVGGKREPGDERDLVHRSRRQRSEMLCTVLGTYITTAELLGIEKRARAGGVPRGAAWPRGWR